ncbi:amidohydrolase [Zobellella aerophila]|uniref:Amidohydrolase n=1 Tax=Zobellella aerophila TaxID=870480 RepID=A0ABP6W2M1_9GAMM
MPTLNLSLLQQPLHWHDGPANLAHFDGLLARLHDQDLIVLPEMFTTGFAMDAARHALPESEVYDWLFDHAQRLHAMIGGSVALQTEQGAVNRFILVDPHGAVYRYDKRHLFRMAGEHEVYQPGERRLVIDWKGFRILPQICYDLRFPVWSRNRGDYDLALYVANWPAPRAHHWTSLLTARAIENQAFVAGCNRVGHDHNGLSYSGNSLIIDPQGGILAKADAHQAAVLQASLSLTELRDYRERFPAWMDADDFRLE